MIVRGTAAELALNREGRIAPSQQERLKQLPIFRLPYWPSLLLAPIVIGAAMARGGIWIWIGMGLGLLLLINGYSRMRQQQRLATGYVEALEGRVERQRPAPGRAFEAELTVAGRRLVLLGGVADEPLQPGAYYRFYFMRGLAFLPIVLAVETVD